jgi:hypothetical protein
MSLYAVRRVGARALLPRDLFGRGDESPRRVTDNDFFGLSCRTWQTVHAGLG